MNTGSKVEIELYHQLLAISITMPHANTGAMRTLRTRFASFTALSCTSRTKSVNENGGSPTSFGPSAAGTTTPSEMVDSVSLATLKGFNSRIVFSRRLYCVTSMAK